MLSEIIRTIGQMFTWIVVVAPWEQAVRVRLGKRVSILPAGTFLRIPFIDRVYRQSVRRRISIIAPQTLTTHDGKSITVGAAIGYEVRDLLKLYQTLHDASDTIESEVSAMVAAYIAEHDFADCQPPKIEKHVADGLRLSDYGLEGTEFYITNFAAVRTLRLITGEMRSWQKGECLNTTYAEGAPR